MILKKEILETKRKNIDETIDLIQIQKNICMYNVSLLNIILSNYVANILRCNDYTSPLFVILLSFILFYILESLLRTPGISTPQGRR